jgi:hypothetical protein
VDNFPPIRPICPDIGTETANSAKYVALALKPIMVKGTSFVKSSYELVELVSKMHNLPSSCCLVTVDIDSLYPSIPPLLAFQIIKRAVSMHTPADTLPKRHAEFVLELLRIQLFGNVMEFGDEFFEQVTGIPMGRAWAPAVASIFMDYWDGLVLSQLQQPPLLYKRYLDDIFVITRSENDAHAVICTMRNTMSCIKIGSHSIGRSVNFLDVQLSLMNNERHCNSWSCANVQKCTYTEGAIITSRLFRKPLDLGVVLDFKSAHSYNVKVGVLFGQCARICRLSSHSYFAGQDIRNLMELMIELRHCPASLRRKLHKRVLLFLVTRTCYLQRMDIEHNLTHKNVSSNHTQMYVHLRVPLSTETHFLRKALNDFRNRLSLDENDRVISRIVFQSTSNLARTLIYKGAFNVH